MNIRTGIELKEVIQDYFRRSRAYCPQVTSEMLDGNGTIFYMNGNDSTPFDWGMNNRLCELMMFYKETKLGFIKLMIKRSGSLDGYLYLNEGKANAIHLPQETIQQEEVEYLYRMLCRNADDKDLYDRPIDEIEFAR